MTRPGEPGGHSPVTARVGLLFVDIGRSLQPARCHSVTGSPAVVIEAGVTGACADGAGVLTGSMAVGSDMPPVAGTARP